MGSVSPTAQAKYTVHPDVRCFSAWDYRRKEPRFDLSIEQAVEEMMEYPFVHHDLQIVWKDSKFANSHWPTTNQHSFCKVWIVRHLGIVRVKSGAYGDGETVLEFPIPKDAVWR